MQHRPINFSASNPLTKSRQASEELFVGLHAKRQRAEPQKECLLRISESLKGHQTDHRSTFHILEAVKVVKPSNMGDHLNFPRNLRRLLMVPTFGIVIHVITTCNCF
jgi:hypothetical protein